MLPILGNIILAVLPCLIALVAGYLVGKYIVKAASKRFFVQLITPIVWVILFTIGLESGEAFNSLAAGVDIIKKALIYALVTSVIVFIIILPLNQKATAATGQSKGWRALLHPAKECAIAFSLVLLGVFCYRFHWQDTSIGKVAFHITYWLYLLLFCIGVDLSNVKIDRSWLAPRVLLIPLFVVIGSLLAGLILSFVTGEKLSHSLALTSGYGWFSLSATLASQHIGTIYGSVALLIDLFRELLGIMLVYLFGRNQANSAIGVCGATSLDTTLPFVIDSCEKRYMPTAIMSGLILTILAPFMMLFFYNL